MKGLAEQFLDRIDDFLVRSGMSASAFGHAAVGDPNLVADLRQGRMPTVRTIETVMDFINSRSASKSTPMCIV